MYRDIQNICSFGILTDELYFEIKRKVKNLIFNDFGGIIYPKPYYKVYIGHTNDCVRRWDDHLKIYNKNFPQNPVFPTKKQHLSKRPDVMFLVYQTDAYNDNKISDRIAKKVESQLIHDFKGYIINDPNKAKSGRIGDSPHFVYVLIMRYNA